MKPLLLITVTLFALRAAAADFMIDWWTVDGGGAASSGGGFTVTGTIAQPDAGVMSGGGFTLQGGFWGPPGEAGPEQPLITITHNPNGTITVEWIGGGTMLAAPTVLGPWTDVPGATSPYTFVPTMPMLFIRIRQ